LIPGGFLGAFVLLVVPIVLGDGAKLNGLCGFSGLGKIAWFA